MPTVYSNKGLNSSPVFFSDKGNLACIQASYTAASLAAGSTIRMVKVPAGATVVDGYITHDAMGASVTLSLGDEDNATRFRAATAASSAATKVEFNQAVPYTYTAEKWLTVTVGGAAATGTVKFVVYYIME